MDRPPVVYPGDEYYVPKTNTTVVNSKGDYDLIVDISDITDDKNATIRVTVPSDATGNVTMTVTGEDYNITVNGTIKDGVAEITLPILPAGKYNITTTYPSDDKYAQKTDIEEVISKITDYDMNVTVIEPEKFGENATIIVEVPGETYTGTINNGSAEITLPVLPAGKHDITVDYAGDDNYAPKTNTTSVVSKKTGYDMNVTVVDPGIGGNKTIIVDLPENATGNVTVTIDGNKTITVPVINGTANVTLPVLPEGKHNITVDFSDDKYADKQDNETITSKGDYDLIIVVPEDVTDNKNATIKVIVLSDATGSVTITVDGKDYTGVINNGSAEITLAVLPAGEYDITATYGGNDKYAPKSNTTSMISKKTDYDMNVTVIDPDKICEKTTVIVEVPKDATGNVTIIDENTTITVPVKDGIANVTLPVLPEGDHNITVDFSDDKYAVNKTMKLQLLKEIMI